MDLNSLIRRARIDAHCTLKKRSEWSLLAGIAFFSPFLLLLQLFQPGVGEVKLLTILLYGDLCSWSLNTAPYVSTLLILQHTK